MRWMLTAVIFAWAELAAAQTWMEPPRGSPERRDLMDAFRPEAEELFGAPVEFVVNSLRVSGDLAFASVSTQRSGGGAIDCHRTPGWAQGYFIEDAYHIGGQALLRRASGRWVVADFHFGATDVWWAYGPICAEFRPVIADACP